MDLSRIIPEPPNVEEEERDNLPVYPCRPIATGSFLPSRNDSAADVFDLRAEVRVTIFGQTFLYPSSPNKLPCVGALKINSVFPVRTDMPWSSGNRGGCHKCTALPASWLLISWYCGAMSFYCRPRLHGE